MNAENKLQTGVFFKILLISLLNHIFTPLAGNALFLKFFGMNFFKNTTRSVYQKVVMYMIPCITSITVIIMIVLSLDGLFSRAYLIVHFAMLVLL